MKRIVLFGHSPLPIENSQRTYALSKRTWQFVKPLIDHGYQVCLVAFRLPKAYSFKLADQTLQINENFIYYNLSNHMIYDFEYLQRIIDTFKPNYCIGITTLPSSILSQLDISMPFWADLYGSILAESQIKASTFNDDLHFDYFLNLEQTVLRRADKISTVSDKQRLAVIGELGLMGRLNSKSAGYEFIHSIPAATDNTRFTPTSTVIRGRLVESHAFIILYSGGYNTWTDIDTLFHGLVGAMAKNSTIHFVSTGGQIEGHDEQTYQKFVELIENSDYKERFHLCGWVEFDVLHNFYLESDLGIISDKVCYEAELGSRTRLLDWLRSELPAIVNPISELTYNLVEQGVAFGFPAGDANALTSLLIHLVSNPQYIKHAKIKTRDVLLDQYSIPVTMKPLIRWLEADSSRAPDHKYNIPPRIQSTPLSVAQPFTVSWYEVLQPVWSKLIYVLSSSPLRFVVPIMKMISKLLKRFRQN